MIENLVNTYIDAIKQDISNSNLNHITDNLTPDERQALRNLKKKRDIIIKPADRQRFRDSSNGQNLVRTRM